MDLHHQQQRLSSQLAALLVVLLIGAASFLPLASASPEKLDYLSTFKSRALVRVWPGFAPQLDCAKGCFEIEETYDRSRQLGKLVVNAGGERSELYVRAKDKLYLEAHFSSNGSLERCSASQVRPGSGYFGMFGKVAELAEKQAAVGSDLGYFVGPSALIYLFRGQLNALWSARQARGLQLSEATNGTAQPEAITVEYNLQESKKRHRLFVEQDLIELSLLEDPNLKVSFKLASFSLDRSPLLAKLAPYMSFTDSQDQTYQIDYLSIEENLNLSELGAKDPFHLPVGGFACVASKITKEYNKWNRNGGLKEEQGSALLAGPAYQLMADDSSTTSWPNWANRMDLLSNQMSAKIYSLSLYPEGVELALDTEKHKFHFDIIGHSKNVLDLRRNLIFHLPYEPLIESSNFHSRKPPKIDNTEEISPTDSESVGYAQNPECSILTTSEVFSDLTSLAREGHASFDSLKRWHFFIGNTNSMMYLGKTQHNSGHLAHEFELSYSKVDELPAFFTILLASDWREIKLEGSSLFLGAKLHILADSCPVHLYETNSCNDPVFLAFRVELIDLKTMILRRSEEIRLNEFHWSLIAASGQQDGLTVGTQSSEQLLIRCPLSKFQIQLEVRWMEAIPMGREGEDSPDKATTKTGLSKVLGQCRSSGLKSLDEFVADQWALWMDSYFGQDNLLVGFDRHSIPGTKVAKYSIELAEGPKQVLSFTSQNLPGSQAQAQVTITMNQTRRSGRLGATNLVAQTSDTRTLFECLTWAARSSAGQMVLRSPETGECLLFDKREEISKLNTASDSPEEQDGDEEMQSENLKVSPEKRSAKSTAATRYNVYLRELGQPKSSDSHKGTSIHERLSSMNQAILGSNKISNNFQACIEPTRFARDIRFGVAKVMSDAAGKFGRSSPRSLPHRSGYRFALADSVDLKESNEVDLAFRGWQRTQIRALDKVSSFAQCSIGCDEEPSCSAFAFCHYPESGYQYCQLSSLRVNNTSIDSPTTFRGQDDKFGSTLVRDANCDIHVKDYLLYFQATDSSNVASEFRGSGWRLAAKGATQLDCANTCYQSQASGNAPLDGDINPSSSLSETCIRFVHCQKLDWCFHWLTGSVEPVEIEQKATKNAFGTFETNPKLLTACTGFKRTALSLYKRTLSHVDHDWIGENLFQERVSHLNKASCAEKCTQDSECQSFDECRIVMTSKSKQQRKISSRLSSSSSPSSSYIECVQLSGSVYNNDAEGKEKGQKIVKVMSLVNSTITSEMFKIERHCDHFERLEAERRLSTKQVGRLIGKANLVAASDSDNLDESDQADGGNSYATTLFCAALLGLTLGLLASVCVSEFGLRLRAVRAALPSSLSGD